MKLRSLIALCALLMAALPIHAASDYLLVLEGVLGESDDKKYQVAIDLQTFSLGVSATIGTTAGGGTTAGKATFSDLVVTKKLDKSSPFLFLHCAQGKHIPTATLILRKAGERPLEYFVVKLTDVIITSVQTSGGVGGEIPQEQLSLNYSKIEYIYTPQKLDGSADTPVNAGWDIKANVKL